VTLKLIIYQYSPSQSTCSCLWPDVSSRSNTYVIKSLQILMGNI